ncbi:hypothetical protein PZB74_18580 [Porifericola rhodea]|uniref:hypothetical protein n=1 Tax=Porifericola rhodea TaxID=930972 RepID=UPI002666F229|nr:hypothetical protein [Porifericola rhodea]WKN30964.1 hypothetical protein PZB74_18580 [Porifericola rhodea]
MRQSIVYFLSSSRNAIEISMKNKTILKKLKSVGYDLPKLKEGKVLNEEATIMQMMYKEKYGNQYNNSQNFYTQKKDTEKNYKKHLQLARVAYYEDKEMINRLHLGRQSYAVDQWLERAKTFYTVILDDTTKMNAFGISVSELDQMLAEVEALIASRQDQISSKGEAQNATQQRNDAFDALDAWMRDFRKAARFAMRDEPQLLESLGIKVASTY